MARDKRTVLLAFARVWAHPLWYRVTRSEPAAAVAEDVDRDKNWINDAGLLKLDHHSPFAHLIGAPIAITHQGVVRSNDFLFSEEGSSYATNIELSD